MFLKIILFSLVVSPLAMARDITVTEGLKSYTLKASDTFVELRSQGIKLSLVKQACNEGMIKKFSSQVELMLNRATKQVQPIPQSVKVSDGSSEFYSPVRSPAGKFFQAIPDEMKRLKMEESLRCKSK